MKDHTSIYWEAECPSQDIDDLIFGDQIDLCVSER